MLTPNLDEMKHTFLYHLNAYTYAMDGWHPTMSPKMRAFFKKATTGILEGKAGKPAREVAKMDGQDQAGLPVP